MSNSFKSYVDFDEPELSESDLVDENDSLEVDPKLLPGEVIVAEAKNVLKFAPLSERKQGVSGSLFVTNFRLSFVTAEDLGKGEFGGQQNRILSDYDICLINIDHVYQLFGDKKKKLPPGVSVFKKVKALYVVCKNFRIHTFSFKFSPVDHGRVVTNALVHHAYPEKHDRIFVYDYSEPPPPVFGDTCLFSTAADWEEELQRTRCPGWRLSRGNEDFKLFPYLPEAIVVPRSIVDKRLEEASQHFQGVRPAVWSWGNSEGCALVRMGHLHPTITDSKQENVTLELIRKAHPYSTPPIIVDLQVCLPSLREILSSFQKLKDMCTPETSQSFWQQDAHYLSQLDSTRWLHLVSSCLEVTLQAVTGITKEHKTVVLQEGQGRDISAVICSLIQILIDPYYRCIAGFQSLIQKEWVSLGHPFVERLGHIMGKESEQCPLFLLYLDCVWQLTEQFPSSFEFTETYLTTLWDSAHISIFDTFLFNCEKDRRYAREDYRHPLRAHTVWEWSEQFGQQEISLFYNPLYTITQQIRSNLQFSNGFNRPSDGLSTDEINQLARLKLKTDDFDIMTSLKDWSMYEVLPINPSLVELWQQCYLRWLPVLEVVGGGKPQVYFQQQLLVEEICHLQKKIGAMKRGHQPMSPVSLFGPSPMLTSRDSSQLTLHQYESVNSFYPFNPGTLNRDRRRSGYNSTGNAIELLLQNSFLAELSDSQALFADAD